MSGCSPAGLAIQSVEDSRPSGRCRKCSAWPSVLLRILGVIVQQFGRSEHRGGGKHLVVLALDIGAQDRLMLCGDHFLDGLVLARHQIDAKLVSKCNQVAPGTMVTLDILSDQLL